MVKYAIGRVHEIRRVPGGHEVHYMSYHLLCDDGSLSEYLLVPCRAKLHHTLTGIFYNWDWNDENFKEITFDEAMMLKHVFTNQTEYKLWKQAIEKIAKEGVEKGKEWLIDQIKVLAMRNVMEGK